MKRISSLYSILGLLTLLSGAAPLFAGQTNQNRIPIETAMRAWQERTEAVSRFQAYWYPNSEQIEPGAYPVDGFYGDDAKNPATAAALVTNLYFEIQNNVYDFLRPPASGNFNGVSFFNYDARLAADFPWDAPFDDSGNIDQNAYVTVFNQLVAIINNAKLLEVPPSYQLTGANGSTIGDNTWGGGERFVNFAPFGTGSGYLADPDAQNAAIAQAIQDMGTNSADPVLQSVSSSLPNLWQWIPGPSLIQEVQTKVYASPAYGDPQQGDGLYFYYYADIYTRSGTWTFDLSRFKGTADFYYGIAGSVTHAASGAYLVPPSFRYVTLPTAPVAQVTLRPVSLATTINCGQIWTSPQMGPTAAQIADFSFAPAPNPHPTYSQFYHHSELFWTGYVIVHCNFARFAELGPVPDDTCPTCSNEQCSPGALDATDACLDFRINLGQGPDGPAGYFRLHAESPSPTLVSPLTLQAHLQRGVVALLDAAGVTSSGAPWPRQLLLPQGFLDTVILDQFSYECRFYAQGNQGTLGADGYYHPTTQPYRTIRVEDPDRIAGQLKQVRITVTEGNPIETDLYSFDAANNAWTLAANKEGASRTDLRTVTIDSQTGNRTEVLTVKDQAGAVASTEKLVFATFPWNSTASGLNSQELIEDTIDPNGLALKTTYQYHTDASDTRNYSRLKYRIDPSGFWTKFEYDSYGKVSRETTPFLNAALGATKSLRIHATTRSDDIPNETIVDTLVLPDGTSQEVGRSYRIFDYNQIRTIQCQTPGAAWDAADNLVSTTTTIDEGEGDFAEIFWGKIKRSLRPDGTGTVYNYSQQNGLVTTTISDGVVDPNNYSVTIGKRTVRATDNLGQTISETVFDIATAAVISSRTATAFDFLGRVTQISYSDGTSETRSYGCCGLDYAIDRQGIRTDYLYDGYRRVISSTTAGVTTQYTYDAVGRQTSVSRFGTNGPQIPVSATTYDAGGEVLSVTTAGLRTTSYAKTLDASGQTVRTTTSPDGGTRIETYAIDGSLQSVSGTAAFPLTYQYGADADGAAFVKTIKVGSNGEQTEWTKTYSDVAGRSYKTVYPDGANERSYFNQVGQLSRQVDSDGIATLYGYNALGEREYVALDLNGNGQIDLTGADRVTRTHHEIASSHGTNVDRTTTTVWDTAGAHDIVINESSVDGLQGWRTEFGLTSQTQIVFDHAGGRTEKLTGPDGVVTQKTYQSDRLVSLAVSHPIVGSLSVVTYGYDAYGRLQSQTDARTGATIFAYFADDQIRSVTTPDPDSSRSGPGYDAQATSYTYDGAGRLSSVTRADGGVVNTTYYPTGQQKRTWGAQTYPSEYAYDSQGRIKTLTTWQNFAGDAGRAVTAWNYDSQRGWLSGKTYADGKGPSYTYTPAGRLKTRVWARAVTTTYGYNGAGDLSGVSYSDGTPAATFTYDALGRLATKSDGTGTCTYAYLGQTSLIATETHSVGLLNGLTVTRSFDSLNRLSGLSTGTTSSVLNQAIYGYDAASRLKTVTSGANVATYGYLANSALVGSIAFASNGTTRLTSVKGYDNLNRLTSISHALNAQSPSLSYAYTYNNANQRVQATREDSSSWNYGYDTLGQVTSAQKRNADTTAALGQSFAYSYDDIGNRKTATTNSRQATYLANALNQYSQRTVPGAIDMLGSADSAATVTVNLGATQRQSGLFYRAVPADNSTAPAYPQLNTVAVKNLVGPNGEDAIATDTRQAFLAKNPEIFTYDTDGNLLTDGRWTYTWDAENRLTAMETLPSVVTIIPALKQRLEFAYDGYGRRIQKKVSNWDATSVSYQLASDTRFIYDGWNVLNELNGVAPTTTATRAYVWGLDLSGSPQGAGGVGGLLMGLFNELSGAIPYGYAYDGNGNVVALIDLNVGAAAGIYDYDAFGGIVLVNGLVARANGYRFSTKYQDTETSLSYYGLRYYNSSTGRWISRDPLEEVGGSNLVGFIGNDGINSSDLIGLARNGSGHTYITYLAIAYVLGQPDAGYKLAIYASMPDSLKSRTAYAPGLPAIKAALNFISGGNFFPSFDRIQRYLHSLDGGDPQARRNCLTKMLGRDDLKPWQEGFLIHALGDAYFHVGKDGKLYVAPFGHAGDSVTGQDPDQILYGDQRQTKLAPFLQSLTTTLNRGPLNADQQGRLDQLLGEIGALPGVVSGTSDVTGRAEDNAFRDLAILHGYNATGYTPQDALSTRGYLKIYGTNYALPGDAEVQEFLKSIKCNCAK